MPRGEWDELQTPAAPAAGAGFTHLVPGHTWERVLSVKATFVASGAVANRLPFLAFTNGDGVEFYRSTAGAVVTAGLTVTGTWSRELDTNPQITAGFFSAPMRDELLPSGYHVLVGLTLEDVADQISSVELFLRRYPTGPMAPAYGANYVLTEADYE